MYKQFKVGDKFRLKKFSEEKFKEIYVEKYPDYNLFDYKKYLNHYANYFHKIGEITKIDDEFFKIEFQTGWDWFFPEELEKACILSDKIKVLKELLS